MSVEEEKKYVDPRHPIIKSVETILVWLFLASFSLAFLTFVGIAFYLFIIIPSQHEHGLDRQGAYNKHYEATQAGNGREAIFWAKKAYAYEIMSRKESAIFHDENALYLINCHFSEKKSKFFSDNC